jgi:hypothetical protein
MVIAMRFPVGGNFSAGGAAHGKGALKEFQARELRKINANSQIHPAELRILQ